MVFDWCSPSQPSSGSALSRSVPDDVNTKSTHNVSGNEVLHECDYDTGQALQSLLKIPFGNHDVFDGGGVGTAFVGEGVSGD